MTGLVQDIRYALRALRRDLGFFLFAALIVGLGIEPSVANFLGGTGLLIVVSVSLDLVQKIEANLLMRSYEGFSSAGRIKGAQG